VVKFDVVQTLKQKTVKLQVNLGNLN